MRTALLVLLGVTLVLIPAGCSSSGTSGPMRPTPTKNVGSADEFPYETQLARNNATATSVASRPFSAAGMSVRIVRAGLTWAPSASGRLPEFLDVSVNNSGNAPHAFSASDFTCVDQVGNTYPDNLKLSNRQNLGSGTLGAGQSRQGWLGCAVPRDTTELAVTWSDRGALSPPIEIARYDRGR